MLITLASSSFWPIKSGFHVGPYVQRLTLQQQYIHSQPPWIHSILYSLPHCLLPNLRSRGPILPIQLIILGSAPDAEGILPFAPPSVYQGLPRQLPLIRSRLLTVTLREATFRSFKNIVSLVSEVAVDSFRGESVRWSDHEVLNTHTALPTTLAHVKSCKRIPRSINVRNSTSWPFVWILLLLHGGRCIRTSCTYHSVQSMFFSPSWSLWVR